ncbi:hypothetical protein LCGC14_0664410 [marine sediment metagenome]|uniref:Glycosyltransferase RgtA/B/C/D-like domain-containing protein n=1 Tax=marine sediment metagenome TaxID=412755 RepID=A0A0F9QSR8_9ZZZZ
MFNFKTIFYSIKYRNRLIIFFISLFCILFMYLKVIHIENFVIVTNNLVLFLLIQLLLKSSAIFTILFLPTYPIFFILLKNKAFHFREKLGITIVSNLSFYIIIGYIGSYFSLPITFEYFLFTLILAYFSILLIVISHGYYRGTGSFLKKVKSLDYEQINNKKFSLLNLFKSKISLNWILLSIVIILISILNVVNTSTFAGTDAWLHISLVKYITEINYVPMDSYFGTLGLHIFGAVIHFFSGLDLLLLPKYFGFYTIPLASLIVYNLLMRIFKNKNLAIFGVFFLVSSMGFSWFMLVQFWPSGIALIQGLVIFFILYVRLQGLIKEQIPKKEEFFSNILFSYVLLIFIFISSFLTHSLLTMILVITYLWVYLIYFVRNYRRGFDLLLIILFFSIFFIFYYFNIGTGHFQVFDPFRIVPWYYLLIGALASIFAIPLILLRYRKSMDFSRGTFLLIITGKKKRVYKKIEDRFIFPIVFGLITILSIVFTLFSLTLFKISVTYVIYFIDMLIISSFAIWGLLIFQYKPRGKPLFFWGLALDLMFLLTFLYDGMVGMTTFFLRVGYITVIIITIGFVSYLYKLVKTNSFQKRKFQIFLISVIIFSSSISFLYDSTNIDIFNLREREVSSIQWYSNYTSNEEVIISKYGWHAIFMYYDYPFEDKNKELTLESIHFFFIVDNQLVHPNLHISNGSNILKDLKLGYNTEVILVLPKDYYSPLSWRFFDQLSEEETEAYYNLEYLNRIFSAKGEDGEETPYYWVI